MNESLKRRVILISCVSKKLSHKARAEDLYISPLFRLNLKYARTLMPDAIYILSAKYGMLALETKIEPYNITLNNISSAERRIWSQKILEQIKVHADLHHDHFILLAGQSYRRYLTPQMISFEAPLKGLGIGKQLQKLKKLTS